MAAEQHYWAQAHRRRLSRRTLLRGSAVGAGALAASAIGCGGGTKSNAGTSAGSQAAALATAAARSGPAAVPTAGNFKTGGTIQLRFTGPIGLDPFENSSFRAQELSGFSYSRLFRFMSGPDPSTFQAHQPVGDLVDSYETTPDGLTYALKLKRNVMFHPPLNRPLTSADVTATYQRFTTDEKNTNAAVFKPIVDSLAAPDDQTLVFKLKIPYAPFLNKLANPQYLWIMSRDVVDGKIDPSKQMIGTGPWIFAGASPTAYTYKRNPDFFIKGIPYADGVVVNIIPDVATNEAQFQAGKIDYYEVPAADVDVMKKAVPKANVASFTNNLLSFIFFTNVTAPDSPFKDVRMRRAVSLAIDRDGLLALGYNSQGAWSNLINPGMGKWWLDPQGKEIGDAGQWFKHDPKQARQLLNAAGHASTEFKFIYPNNAYGDVYNSLADAARGMLADAGFKLTVVTVDYQKDYINNGQGIFFKGAPSNGIVYALETPFSDPDDYLNGMLLPDGNRNHSKVDDPNLTALLKKEQAETDEAKRLDLVKQVQKLADEQMYYSPNIIGNVYSFYQPWVENRFVTNDFSYGLERVAYLSLNK